MKAILKLILKPIKPLFVFFIEKICYIFRLINYICHKMLFHVTWSIPPSPDNFDHFIDIYYLWMKTQNPMFFERGIIGRFSIKDNSNVLELSCGDGFCTKYFYAQKAKMITAIDYDYSAIRKAKKINSAKNIQYLCMDIREKLPDCKYDNIVWDIGSPFNKYFSEKEFHNILARLKEKLNEGGVLSGYTSIDEDPGDNNVFIRSSDQLRIILAKHFKNVNVYETKYPERNNLYFCASDLEFSPISIINWRKT